MFTLGSKLFDFSQFFGDNAGWWGWLLIVPLIVAILGVAACFVVPALQKKKGIDGKFSTRELVYAAACLAISFVLGLFGPTMPQGGTITFFSTVPIIIFCYYFGFAKGMVVCFINMLLQFFCGVGYIIHPMSGVLDYVIPYMALAITGLFPYKPRQEKEYNPYKTHYKVYIASLIYVIIRYISHITSGFIFYGEWAEWQPAWAYNLAYNSFVFADFAIAMVGLAALLASKSFNTFMASHRNTLQNANRSAENNK